MKDGCVDSIISSYQQTFYLFVQYCGDFVRSFLNKLCVLLLQARSDHCDQAQKGGVMSRKPASVAYASAPQTSVISSFVIFAAKLFSTVCGRSFVYYSIRRNFPGKHYTV